MLFRKLIFLSELHEAVSKAIHVRDTPKSPRGDFLTISIFLYPPWGAGGKIKAFETPSCIPRNQNNLSGEADMLLSLMWYFYILPFLRVSSSQHDF